MAKQTKTAAGVPPVKKAPVKKAPVHDWGAEQTTGMEQVHTEDLGIPFLIILQKGSAEVDKTHKNYASKKIAGAEAGDIINTVTREILHKCEGEPLVFTPCTYQRMYPEWRPQDVGGGFVQHHSSADILAKCTKSEEDGRDYLPNGNNIVTTCYFFGYTTDENNKPQPCVISMASTQLKKSRQWLNIIMSLKVDSASRGRITPPMFSHRYNLTSVPEQNARGSWFGWGVECGGIISEPELIDFGRTAAKQMGLGTNRPQLSAPAKDEDSVPV